MEPHTPIAERPQLKLTALGRTGYVVFGIVLPLICFVWSNFGYPFTPDWQSGELEAYCGLMLHRSSTWPFYPLLAYSMVCMALLVWRPGQFVRLYIVRFGIYTGVLLALQYCLIFVLPAGTALLWIVPMGVLVIVIPYGVFVFLDWLARRLGWIVWCVVVVLSVAGLMLFSVLQSSPGEVLIVLPIMAIGFFSTPWCLGAYTILSIRLLLAIDGPWLRTSLARCFGLITWLAAWFAAWRLAVNWMLEEYARLPKQPPSRCYMATAAARGHAWLVGSRPVRCADGSCHWQSKQLYYLKALEFMLLCAAPRMHRAVRRVYDWIGPLLAARLNHPLLADLAFLTLKPVEWFAQAMFCLLRTRR